MITDDIQNQINQIVEKRVAEILNNEPKTAIAIYQKQNALLEKKIEYYEAEIVPDANRWKRHCDLEGLISCSKAAKNLKIPYFPHNQKKPSIMGRDILIQLLTIDGVVFPTAEGYELFQKHINRGYGETRQTDKNGMMKTSALFTAKGMSWLVKKYENDTRTWRRDEHRTLHQIESNNIMGLPHIRRESEKPHVQVEEPLGGDCPRTLFSS